MPKCTPTENFLRLARPNVFATGSNDAKTNADRTIFRLARPKHKYPPTELFSRLVRPKILTTGANDVKMKADRNFFAWFDQSKKVCGPHFFATDVTEARATADQSVFASIATEIFSTGVTEAKVSADRSLFAIGATVVQLTAYRNFFATEVTAARMNADRTIFRLTRPKHKYPPTELFSRLVKPWFDQSKIVRWPHFFATEVTEARATADQSVFASIATENFSTGVTEAKVSVDRSLFAIGAIVVQLTAYRNFFCNWGDCSTNERRPKCFRDWRVRKFLRLARPTWKSPPT